jgi:hypothetical protein
VLAIPAGTFTAAALAAKKGARETAGWTARLGRAMSAPARSARRTRRDRDSRPDPMRRDRFNVYYVVALAYATSQLGMSRTPVLIGRLVEQSA